MFFIAVLTRSGASLTSTESMPTMLTQGIPSLTSTSTMTFLASAPHMAAAMTQLYIFNSPFDPEMPGQDPADVL
jgi:hypothetical protein